MILVYYAYSFKRLTANFAVSVEANYVRPTWTLTNEVKVLCRKITISYFSGIR